MTVHFTCADQAGLSGLASCTSRPDGRDERCEPVGDGNRARQRGQQQLVHGQRPQGRPRRPDGRDLRRRRRCRATSSARCRRRRARPSTRCRVPAGCTGVVAGGLANGVGHVHVHRNRTRRRGERDDARRSPTAWSTRSADSCSRSTTPRTRSVWTTSIFKAGSTVPVKFEIHRADGTAVSPNSAPQWLTPVKGSPLSAAVDESAYSLPATDR